MCAMQWEDRESKRRQRGGSRQGPRNHCKELGFSPEPDGKPWEAPNRDCHKACLSSSGDPLQLLLRPGVQKCRQRCKKMQQMKKAGSMCRPAKKKSSRTQQNGRKGNSHEVMKNRINKEMTHWEQNRHKKQFEMISVIAEKRSPK